jgi:Mn2+/Fe2+ NRAMP family transporter
MGNYHLTSAMREISEANHTSTVKMMIKSYPPSDRLASDLALVSDGIALTPEDFNRSRDRARVVEARRRGRRSMLLWLLTGPGVLAMLGENDGPSMLSYAASGATYGIGFFLPFIAVTFLASFVVQEMSMRLGAVTHRGYGELIFQRFGPFWGWMSAVDLVVTNLITLVTEVIAVRVGMTFFGVPPVVAVGCAVMLVVIITSRARYWRWERLAMALALFNLLFVVVAVLARPSPGQLAAALATWTPLPTGTFQEFLLILASNIGATVTPWMLFFQQSASADKGLTPKDIPHGRRIDRLCITCCSPSRPSHHARYSARSRYGLSATG